MFSKFLVRTGLFQLEVNYWLSACWQPLTNQLVTSHRYMEGLLTAFSRGKIYEDARQQQSYLL